MFTNIHKIVSKITILIVVTLCTSKGSTQHVSDNVFLLESYPSYAVVLPISGQNEGEMSYVVKSPRFHRVMAVIQYLNLPPNKDFTCGSYLQFQDGVDTRSERICGNFDPEEKGFDPASLIGKRSYVSSRDTLRVSLVISHTQAVSSYARISFTAFRDDCYFVHQRNGSSEGTPRYRPCEYSVNEDGIGRQCIVSSLFCDQVLHCAGLNSEGKDFAEDESQMNCPHIYHISQVLSSSFLDASSSTGTNTNLNSNESKTNPKGNEIGTEKAKDEGTFRRFFDEREEHLANLFKSAIIGFVGLCTFCIVLAFVIAMFCLRNNDSSNV